MNENVFRILAGVILFTGICISTYHRRKADKDTGEKISRSADGTPIMLVIRVFGLIMWMSPIVYLINPNLMAWAKIGMPDTARWIGVVIGALCTMGIYWLFSSIGSGISPTSATRKEHQLSTSGPYRWVRHPLYTIGASFYISFGLMADNWFIALMGVISFIVMAIRTPKEEANLIEKFGDQYRKYMKHTGRFFPKLH